MTSSFLEEANKPLATCGLCRKILTLGYMKVNQEFHNCRIQTREIESSLELAKIQGKNKILS